MSCPNVMSALAAQRSIQSGDTALAPELVIERLESLLGPAVLRGFP